MAALDANAGRPGTVAAEVAASFTSSKRDPPSWVATVRVYVPHSPPRGLLLALRPPLDVLPVCSLAGLDVLEAALGIADGVELLARGAAAGGAASLACHV